MPPNSPFSFADQNRVKIGPVAEYARRISHLESSYKLSPVSIHAEARAATVTDFDGVFSPKILFP